MSKTHQNSRKYASILLALTCSWMILAAPTPASADGVNWRIYGSAIDTPDLSEAFGFGLRVSFPLAEKWELDVGATYYEDFKNRFEDDSDDRIGVEVGTLPIDIGVTWTKNGDSGFQVGFGGTYGLMDIDDISISGVGLPVSGDANDDFGGYVKLGYQAQGGFFTELNYRLLDVKVESVEISGIPAPDFTIDMDSFSLQVGYRF